MEKLILEYLVQCPGAEKKGHPLQRIETNFKTAALAADQLHEEFPEHDVYMYALEKREIKCIRGKPLEPKCPRGCSGERDGRPVIIRTQGGLVQCSICGYLGE